MSCTRHFLNFNWEHHSWRPRVVLAEDVPSRDTNMWGRMVQSEFVHCRKQHVCDVCGKTRAAVDCMCDKERGEHCAIRLAWIDRSHQAAE